MNCASCGHANQVGAKFCSECGTPLPRVCASCGRALAPTAKFCDRCGTPAGPVPGAAHGGTDDAVRKTVTVLFADLVGSTALGETLDAESTREVLGEYHAMARSVIEEHGGFLAKFIGDGVMALFGVPETSEDDAHRAVATGVALQQAFAPLAQRAAERHRADLGLRVGLNTGSRSPPTRWGRRARMTTNSAPRSSAGRRNWRDSATHFDEAVARQLARIATVIGAPGVGKTRLSREFCQGLVGDATVVEMRCRRSGTATFAPVADLLRTAADIGDDDSPDQIRTSVRSLVGDLHDADRVAELLASFVGAPRLDRGGPFVRPRADADARRRRRDRGEWKNVGAHDRG